MKVAKVRRCTECKQVFANPDSFRLHKRKDGYCRSEEALAAVGYQITPKGWLHMRAPSEKR